MREPKIPGPHRSRICRVLQARNSRQAWSNHIKIQEKSGAGGGGRTMRAYSFYVTYCKHTNARTAQPAVCPPPMYKIMYNNSKAECVVGLLTPGCAPRLPVYRTASGSFPTATFLGRSTRRGWVPRHVLVQHGAGESRRCQRCVVFEIKPPTA